MITQNHSKYVTLPISFPLKLRLYFLPFPSYYHWRIHHEWT